ncbi:MAG TPA: patatin-like phospholipase family protein [Candidatus Binatia bacterium]
MTRRGLAALFIFLFAVSGCGLWPGGARPGGSLWGSRQPKVALVLGGGAARGFAHVGVIRVLDRQKIPIHMIVGANTGGLIGALYADRKSASELERLALTLEERDLFDYNFITPTQGFARGERLEDFVLKQFTTKDIERLTIPFAAVATDLEKGEAVALETGSIARALRASNAIPGIFGPVSHQGRLLVDGGVLDSVPVDVARRLGADIVIAVDLSDGTPAGQANNIFDTIAQSLFLAARQGAEARLKQADVVIRPKLGSAGLIDFTRKKELLARGMEAAEQALPAIRAKLGVKQN